MPPSPLFRGLSRPSKGKLHLSLWSSLGIGLLLMGCQGLASDGLSQLGLPLPLAQLQGPPIAVEGIPQQPVGNAVTITGQVTQVAPLGSTWFYGVADATGMVWVLTATPPPAVGQGVRVTGQVQYETILLGGRDRGEHYLQEQDRAIVAAESVDAPVDAPVDLNTPVDSTEINGSSEEAVESAPSSPTLSPSSPN